MPAASKACLSRRFSSRPTAARRAGAQVRICEDLEEVLGETDVLYVTRLQKERFRDEAGWLAVKDAYKIDHALLSRAKEEMIVMHPLPRVNGTSSPGPGVSTLTD